MDSITKEEYRKLIKLLINDFKIHSDYILEMNNGTHEGVVPELFKRENKAIIADCNYMNRLINQLLLGEER
jgi:hypothetical protein